MKQQSMTSTITKYQRQTERRQYFTTLDLALGFHQIELNPKDTGKRAFNVEYGHFKIKGMPFGLRNTPATFQRVMDNVYFNTRGKGVMLYG